MSPMCTRVLNHMERYGAITTNDAMTWYGCNRLAARIWDLKRQGYRIKKETATGRNRYGESVSWASYSLEADDDR